MNNLIQFFTDAMKEDNGNPSSMRIYSGFLILVATFVIIYSVLKQQDNLSMVVTILSFAIGGKAVQKKFENKDIKVESTEKNNE